MPRPHLIFEHLIMESLGTLIKRAYPGKRKKLLDGPPDVFAISAYILQNTGAYTSSVHANMAPASRKIASTLVDEGEKWRKSDLRETERGRDREKVTDKERDKKRDKERERRRKRGAERERERE